MSSQQINLFQAELRPAANPLSTSRVVTAIATLVVGMALLLMHGNRQIEEIEAIVAGLEEVSSNNRAYLEQMARVRSTNTPNQLLTARLAEVQREHDALQGVINELEDVSKTYTQGFSAYLAGFARHPVNGLWLTGFRISADSGEMQISGSTIHAENVPVFLQQLAAEDAFAGREFHTFRMVRPERDSEQVDFAIQTRTQDGPG